MPPSGWDTKQIRDIPDVIAPDGSEVRLLCATPRGSTAQFTLAPGAVARPVAHRIVEEIWYVIRGRGRIWRKFEDREEVSEIRAGTSLTIPTGTHFQFRNDGAEPLEIIGVTMPPWSGESVAFSVEGNWPADV